MENIYEKFYDYGLGIYCMVLMFSFNVRGDYVDGYNWYLKVRIRIR